MEVIKKGIEDIEEMVLENSKKIDENAKAIGSAYEAKDLHLMA